MLQVAGDEGDDQGDEGGDEHRPHRAGGEMGEDVGRGAAHVDDGGLGVRDQLPSRFMIKATSTAHSATHLACVRRGRLTVRLSRRFSASRRRPAPRGSSARGPAARASCAPGARRPGEGRRRGGHAGDPVGHAGLGARSLLGVARGAAAVDAGPRRPEHALVGADDGALAGDGVVEEQLALGGEVGGEGFAVAGSLQGDGLGDLGAGEGHGGGVGVGPHRGRVGAGALHVAQRGADQGPHRPRARRCGRAPGPA